MANGGLAIDPSAGVEGSNRFLTVWTGWVERVEFEGRSVGAAVRFWLVALAGLVAAPLIGRGFRALADRRQTRVGKVGLALRFRVAVIRPVAATGSLAVFGVLFWFALISASAGRPILEETADRLCGPL
jgi:hypothetical protein